MNAGGVQSLIGIDIPQTGQKGLIQKSRFYHTGSSTAKRYKLIATNLQRFRAKICKSFLKPQFVIMKQTQSSEATVIVETEMITNPVSTSRFEIKDNEVMLVNGMIILNMNKPSGHFKMNPEGNVAVQGYQNVLTTTINLNYPPFLQYIRKTFGTEGIGDLNQRMGGIDVYLCNRFACNRFSQTAHDCFYFRQFRHNNK